jgi:hypothetical protein
LFRAKYNDEDIPAKYDWEKYKNTLITKLEADFDQQAHTSQLLN